MKKLKLGFIIITLLVTFTLTGCTEPNNDDGAYDFIKECNRTPGCSYSVLKDQCICDKTHDYIDR